MMRMDWLKAAVATCACACALAGCSEADIAGIDTSQTGSAQIEGVAQAAGTSEAGETFSQPYTAWQGYASTAAGSVAAGAVPVSAPVSGEEAWSVELPNASAAVSSLALRQIGQTTYAYAAAGSDVYKVDAATGEQVAHIELPASVAMGGNAAFADGVLLLPLETGSLVAVDEDLNLAWQTDVPAALGGVSVQAASQVASGGGCAYVAFTGADATGARHCVLVACSLYDGSVLWSMEVAGAEGAAAGGDVSDGASDAAAGASATGAGEAPADGASTAEGPSLFYTEYGLLVSDGRELLQLVPFDAAAGDGDASAADDAAGDAEGDSVAAGNTAAVISAELPAGVRLSGRMAAVDGETFVVGDSDGVVYLVTVGANSLELAEVASTGVTLMPAAPVVVEGRAYFLAQDAEGAAQVVAIELPRDGSAEGSLAGVIDLPCDAGEAGTSLTAVAYGTRADACTVELYVVTSKSSICRVVLEGGGIEDARVGTVREGSGNGVTGSLLADRGGALYAIGHNDRGACALICWAADESRAVATVVGGSSGLDTVGATLSGFTLPNGVGLGAGVLIFAAGFGAYAYIRNRGGRRDADEGLDAWREQRGGEDGARTDRGPGDTRVSRNGHDELGRRR